MKVLVMDFGGTYTKYCLMDEHAEITEKGEVPSPVIGVDTYVNTVRELYEKFKDRIDGISISTPGMLNAETGYLYSAGSFIDMAGQNVFELLKPYISVPIALENDGKSGALAEVWKGSLKDVNDGAVVIIGTGIAGGIIKDRRIHRGHNHSAGELSYLLLKPGEYSINNLICMSAAMMGLIPKVATAKGYDLSVVETGLLKRDDVRELVEDTDADTKRQADIVIDGYQIFKWLEEGDPVVEKIYDEFIKTLTLLVFNLQVTYDPEKISIGGGVSAQPRLIKDLRAELEKIEKGITLVPLPKVNVDVCHFRGDANLTGAMYNFLVRYAPEKIGG